MVMMEVTHCVSGPLVSVVIPVFNGRDFVEGAIRSVLGQSYRDVECVVVDDGSTDGSGDIALRFGAAVRVIRQENGGQASALNRGWNVSKGEILGYLSADDLLDPNAVSRLMHALQHVSAPAIVFPNYRLIDREGREIKTVDVEFRGYEWMLQRFLCPVGPGALFHRTLLESGGGWRRDFRQLPDFEFWIRIGSLARFLHVEEVLASFRVHEGSQTFAAADIAKADESVKVADEFSASFELEPAVAREFRSSARIFSACLHLRSGRYIIGFRRVVSAFIERPFTAMSPRSIRRMAVACVSRLRYRRRA